MRTAGSHQSGDAWSPGLPASPESVSPLSLWNNHDLLSSATPLHALCSAPSLRGETSERCHQLRAWGHRHVAFSALVRVPTNLVTRQAELVPRTVMIWGQRAKASVALASICERCSSLRKHALPMRFAPQDGRRSRKPSEVPCEGSTRAQQEPWPSTQPTPCSPNRLSQMLLVGRGFSSGPKGLALLRQVGSHRRPSGYGEE